MDINKQSALFWDYENVPLRKYDAAQFVIGLNNMFHNINFAFKRIYSHKSRVCTKARQILNVLGFRKKDFKWVKGTYTNAADISLISSCQTILANNPEIKQIVLITGDGDFKKLLSEYPEIEFTIICQKSNFNRKLINAANEAVSVGFVAKNPTTWFN